MYINDLLEAYPTETMKNGIYYHGTKKLEYAQNILMNGLMPGHVKQGRGKLSPVAGKVYITSSLEYAVIYGLGGVWMGHDQSEDRYKNDRYGYVFSINGNSLSHVQPDEDSVGEFIMKHTSDGWDQTTKPWHKSPPTFKSDGIDDYAKRRVWFNIKNAMTDLQFKDAVHGYVSSQAAGGKRALKKLSDQDKLCLINWGAHIAHDGAIPVQDCWKIDKSRSKEINKDCSNFFEIAEKIK